MLIILATLFAAFSGFRAYHSFKRGPSNSTWTWSIVAVVSLIVALCSTGKREPQYQGGVYTNVTPSVEHVAQTTSTPQEPDRPTYTPATPKPKPVDHGPERANVKGWWSAEGLVLSQANDLFMQAKEQFHNGDPGTAGSTMADAARAAAQSAQAARRSVPSGWEDVSEKLSQSATLFKSAVEDMSQMMVSNDVAMGQKALGENEAAAQAADDATHLARVHYMSLGGEAKDIMSISDMADGVEQIRGSIEGAASNTSSSQAGDQ